MTFKILTYNIRHGLGIDDRVDLQRIAEVLLTSEADIICLQEVDRGLPRTNFVYQAERLAEILQFDALFHSNFGLPFAGMGNAILSRFPFHSTWNKSLPFTGEPRGLLGAVVAAPFGTITIYSTHWGLTPQQRLKQCSTTVTEVLSTVTPVVLCGDLNATSNSDEIEQLIEIGNLLDCGPNIGKTFTSALPIVKIDYVFASKELTVIDAQIIRSQASDHFPLSVTLNMTSK